MQIDALAQPAWDRVLGAMAAPWDRRLHLLRKADEELRDTVHKGARLLAVDEDVRHWESIRDEARRELVDLDRRRNLAVEKAVAEAAQRAVIGRQKRIEAAKQWAEEMQDDLLKTSRRIAVSRLAGAQRELDMRGEEIRSIGTSPMYRDTDLLHWLAALQGVVVATARRDRKARELVLRPWLQRRAADDHLVRRLEPVAGDHVAPSVTFGEGAMHLVGGERLALVEVRDGNSSLRISGVNGSRCLWQVRPDGVERPAGAVTGAFATVGTAANLVSGAVGQTAQPIICFLGWDAKPAKIDSTILCGPEHLTAVLQALPTVHAPAPSLQAASRLLAELPTPTVEVPQPARLSEFDDVAASDVPDGMRALHALVADARGGL